MPGGWKGWTVVGLAVVLLGVVVGPFVYIHFVESDAPPPLSLSTVTTATGPATTTSSTGGTGPAAGAATTTTTAVEATGGSTPAASQAGSAPLTVTTPSTSTAPKGTTVTTAGAVTTQKPATTAVVATASGAGAWSVAAGSQAGYRVKETLFGQSATAVGRTSAITGSMTLDGSTVSAGTFTVDMTKVTSDQSQRDGQFRGRIMDTSSFPTSTFSLTKPIALGSLPADGVQVTKSATGDLMLHGVTRSVTFEVTAQKANGTIQISGSIPITFADWNIDNPSGGPATVGDTGILEVLLDLSQT